MRSYTVTFDCDPPRTTCAPLVLRLDTNSPTLSIRIEPVVPATPGVSRSLERIERGLRVLGIQQAEAEKALEEARRRLKAIRP